MLSRRSVIKGLASLGAGMGALSLAGCAGSGPSRSTARASLATAPMQPSPLDPYATQTLPPYNGQGRPRATNGRVINPGDHGLDAIIDIHHANKVDDFALARYSGGIMGILHKASEGNDWFDPQYAARRPQAVQAGLLWGAYHFGTRQHTGQEQAEAFLYAAQPAPDTVMALDLEMNERNPANSMTLQQAEDFVSTILSRTGRLPLVYTQPTWADGETIRRTGRSLGGAITSTSILARCDLWLADYRMDPEMPRGWAGRSWRLWQYAGDSSTGGSGPFGPFSRSVAGVARCDRNVFRGGAETLARYWTAEAGRLAMR